MSNNDPGDEDTKQFQAAVNEAQSPPPRPFMGGAGTSFPPRPSSTDTGHLFKYHPPRPDQIPKYERLRSAAKVFADVILECTPPSADQSVAIRHVRDALMNANVSIALWSAE